MSIIAITVISLMAVLILNPMLIYGATNFQCHRVAFRN